MLVLSRKIGEKIQIGPDITITVTAIENGRCKLGFTAPRGIRIDRMEIIEKRMRDIAATGGRFVPRIGPGQTVRQKVA